MIDNEGIGTSFLWDLCLRVHKHSNLRGSMSEDTDLIVARIRDEIARKGWSQTKLAEKALLGDATIFRFFRGDYTIKTLRRIEQALGH